MTRIVRAELLKLRKRATTWVLAGVVLAMIVVFAYVLPWLSVASVPGGADIAPGVAEALQPRNVPQIVLSTLGGFGSWAAVAIGAITTGSEYGWGTNALLLVQGRTRLQILGGRLIALAVALAAIVAAAFIVALALSTVITATLAPIDAPDAGELATAIGGSWLAMAAWTAFGMLLALLIRGAALPIVLGLGYALIIDLPLSVVATIAETTGTTGLDSLGNVLLGRNTFSVANAFTIRNDFVPIPLAEDPGTAAIVVSVYLCVFVALSALVFLRRETP